MIAVLLLVLWVVGTVPAFGEMPGAGPPLIETETGTHAPSALPPEWHYGAYVDLSYILNFNFPENHLWRSRGTTRRHNEFAPNMALAYVRKDIRPTSPWGMELGVQGGYDTQEFGYAVGERRMDGGDLLRHLHLANVSYRAPVGTGLTVTAGLFSSLMGLETLYAKDNANYTRAWTSDFSPYMMLGVTAKYAVSDRLIVDAFIINGYFHLTHENDLPSYGGRWAYKMTPKLTAMQTLYWGPDQANTALEFWRFYGNHILVWTGHDVMLAGSFDVGTETLANQPGHPRTVVMGGNVVARWQIAGPWAVAVRPEFYWDRHGRWTGAQQFVKAMTTTAEYRFRYRWTNTIARLEYRYDESTGAGGGFFRRGEISPGVIGLTPSQHLLLLSVLWSFDSP